MMLLIPGGFGDAMPGGYRPLFPTSAGFGVMGLIVARGWSLTVVLTVVSG
jgi:hypothetical protein